MATVNELDLAPPEDLSRPLWKSLIRNFRDRFLPDQLPPLYLTSRPVNLGMLLGDFLDLPWYRTVFTNLGDVISPETQPPLQLESRPVDVGELVGDMIAHPWWSSLLRSLAYACISRIVEPASGRQSGAAPKTRLRDAGATSPHASEHELHGTTSSMIAGPLGRTRVSFPELQRPSQGPLCLLDSRSWFSSSL